MVDVRARSINTGTNVVYIFIPQRMQNIEYLSFLFHGRWQYEPSSLVIAKRYFGSPGNMHLQCRHFEFPMPCNPWQFVLHNPSSPKSLGTLLFLPNGKGLSRRPKNKKMDNSKVSAWRVVDSCVDKQHTSTTRCKPSPIYHLDTGSLGVGENDKEIKQY